MEEIEAADFLIIGPSDFYSSIIPCILPEGVKEALKKSKAKKIFICPAMTKKGETSGFTAKEFCKKTEEYIGTELDFVIYNNVYPSEERIKKHKEDAEFLDEVFKAEQDLDVKKVIGADLILDDGEIKHDKEKMTEFLMSLINGK
jgi:uncharacterized cofD-like protein